MKYLITGGCGFIGCNFAAKLLDRGDKVIILDNLSRRGSEENLKYLKSLGGKIIFNRADICRDFIEIEKAVEKVEAVFHLAGQTAVTTSLIDPRKDFEANCLGTINLLEAIRKSSNKPTLIYASTNKVYGKLEGMEIKKRGNRYCFKNERLGVSEKQQLDFYSPYGCSKGAADQYVRDYSRSFDLKTVVMRQSCIYGPRQFGIEDQGWVAWFTIASILNKKIVIYGDGKQVRDVLCVDDLFRAWDLAVKNINKVSGEIFNVGGGPNNSLSLLELISYLEKLLQVRVNFNFSDWRLGDQLVYISDISKLNTQLNWKPEISTSQGLKEMIYWIKNNIEKIRRIF